MPWKVTPHKASSSEHCVAGGAVGKSVGCRAGGCVGALDAKVGGTVVGAVGGAVGVGVGCDDTGARVIVATHTALTQRWVPSQHEYDTPRHTPQNPSTVAHCCTSVGVGDRVTGTAVGPAGDGAIDTEDTAVVETPKTDCVDSAPVVAVPPTHRDDAHRALESQHE
jgi:hypothetical protein